MLWKWGEENVIKGECVNIITYIWERSKKMNGRRNSGVVEDWKRKRERILLGMSKEVGFKKNGSPVATMQQKGQGGWSRAVTSWILHKIIAIRQDSSFNTLMWMKASNHVIKKVWKINTKTVFLASWIINLNVFLQSLILGVVRNLYDLMAECLRIKGLGNW